MDISLENNKYRVVQNKDGSLVAFRFGELWRDCIGDKLILALAQEIERLREKTPKCQSVKD